MKTFHKAQGSAFISTITLLVALSVPFSVSASDTMSNQMKHHNQDQVAESHAMQQMLSDVTTEGVVKKVIPETGQLIVHHQPIPEWRMSEMQMKFNLAPDMSVKNFEQGQHIRFRLHHENMMKFTIVEILQ